jgi:serine/threonine protein kinase
VPFEPGARLGRIRIDALLGVGGMGSVYRGFDERLERAVAVKEVHAEHRSSAVRARFLREARALSQLDHPNICRIYDVLERSDGDYLILELIEGETLRHRMARGIPRDEALRIALQVARVLVVAHARGIVHRDLKPENIMLTAAGEVKVLDFGLARFSGDAPPSALHAVRDPELPSSSDDWEKTAVLGTQGETTEPDPSRTSAGSLVGTVTYMSPEQARGLPLDGASDIYSLGVVLYEMLAAVRPYGDADSLNDVLLRVRGGRIEEHDFGRRDLNVLMARLTALQPRDRISAEEAVEAITHAVEQPMRMRRRWLSVAAGVAIVAVLVAAAFAVRRFTALQSVLSDTRGRRIAVLPFRNETGDRALRWVEGGLTELVTGGLAGIRGATVVRPQDTIRTMRGLHIAPGKPLTQPQRAQLLQALDADALIESAIIKEERDTYTIRFAAASREKVDQPREVRSSVLTEAANEMVRHVAMRVDPKSAPADLHDRFSSDPFANMAYAIGQQEAMGRGPKAAVLYYAVAVDRDPDFARAKLVLAEAKNALGEAVEADRLASEVAAWASRRKDSRERGNALVTLAGFRNTRSEYSAAEQAGDEALRIAIAIRDEDLNMSAQNVLGEAYWRTNRLQRAEEAFRLAYRMAVAQRELRAQAVLLNNIGLVEEAQQRDGEAEASYERALRLADRINHQELIATILGNFATIYVKTGRAADAERVVRRQLTLARELGNGAAELSGLVNLAILLYSRGEEVEAIELTAQAADVAKRLNIPRIEALARSNIATALTKRGDLAAAKKANEAALALLPRVGDDADSIADLQLGNAYWLIRSGRVDEAERVIAETERTWRVGARGLRYRARAAYERGDYTRAAVIMNRAHALGEQWLAQDEMMREAILESARTGKPSTVAFEQPIKRP